jgi:hypothetical protein
VQAYGFGPLVDEAESGLGGARTDDERLAVAPRKLAEFLWRAVFEVAAAK